MGYISPAWRDLHLQPLRPPLPDFRVAQRGAKGHTRQKGQNLGCRQRLGSHHIKQAVGQACTCGNHEIPLARPKRQGHGEPLALGQSIAINPHSPWPIRLVTGQRPPDRQTIQGQTTKVPDLPRFQRHLAVKTHTHSVDKPGSTRLAFPCCPLKLSNISQNSKRLPAWPLPPIAIQLQGARVIVGRADGQNPQHHIGVARLQKAAGHLMHCAITPRGCHHSPIARLGGLTRQFNSMPRRFRQNQPVQRPQ